MQGPEGAAQATASWLEQRLPAQLAATRTRLTLLPEQLPDPAIVAAQDRLRLGVEEWPAVLVEVLELRRLVRVDVVDGVEVYAGTYPARVYVMVRGDDEVDVDLVRKRYVLAVRESLLARRQLRPAGAYGDAAPPPAAIVVDPVSLRESYSPTAQDDTGATILGAYVLVDVVVREELPADPSAGVVTTAALDTRPLPHPSAL